MTRRQSAAEDPVVNVYNWSDYIGPDVIDGFTKETGVKVNYDLSMTPMRRWRPSSPPAIPAMMSSPRPSCRSAPAASRPGSMPRSTKAKLKNWGNLDPALLAAMAKYDPGNKFAIPWIAGTVGIGVNVDKVKALLPGQPLDSLDILLKPENAEKLKDCGITMLDSPSDVVPVVLHYLGKDTDSEKPEDLQAVTDLLLKIRPFIRKFDSSGYINDLANGDACLSFGYSTDVVIAGVRAADAKNGVTIHFYQPREGTLEYIDAMTIPIDAPHPDLALKWIDYNLRPEVMAGTANTVNARTGVKETAPLVRPELLADPQTYPTPEVEKTLFTGPVASRAYDRQAQPRLDAYPVGIIIKNNWEECEMSAEVVVVGSLGMDYRLPGAAPAAHRETLLGRGFCHRRRRQGREPGGGRGAARRHVAIIACVGDDDNGRTAARRAGARWHRLRGDRDACRRPDRNVRADHRSMTRASNAIIIVPGAYGRLSPEIVAGHAALLDAAKFVVCQMEVPADTVAWTIRYAHTAGAPR